MTSLFSGKAEQYLFVFAGSVGLTTLLMSLQFNLLEANLYDFRMAHGTPPEPDPNITLVTIDDPTTKSLNEFSPLPLDTHTLFLEALEKFHPKAVGYLVDMNHVSEANPELFRGQWSTRFVETANRMRQNGIPVLLGTPFDVTGEVLPPYPLSSLPHSIAIVHKDGNVFPEDKITRRALTYLYDKPVFHVDLAQQLGLIPQARLTRGSFYVPAVDGHLFFFKYHGNPALQTPPRSYPTLSFIDVLRGSLPDPNFLRDKIVLIGTLTREDSSDYVFTPYSKNSYSNPKIVVHANILDAVIHNQGIIRAPQWVNWIVTFLVTAFVVGWVLNSTPLYGVFATLGLVLIFGLAGQLLFSLKGFWIRESQPLVGIFVGYYLIVPYRLIIEYKKRWGYQRENELLRQVEELKTNFLSLVTHDLKTPVARIQGLAEVLIRKASGRLIQKDMDTLQTIIGSTDELNRFISSILELTKVESDRIQLNLESKDPNQLIERSIEDFKAQCRAMKIKINADLEPLFPIKIDASLISKVINNLIDNALKYSPADSEIRIQSREVGEWIEIAVTDQGIGMTEDEKKNLFTRFYRAKNDTTTKVAGTGLGLYLTRYFVEAHHGRVEVESEKNKGSTFRILLPMEIESKKMEQKQMEPKKIKEEKELTYA